MADPLFDRPHRTRQGAALLMGVGVIVMSIGLFFVAARPGLLPEDIRYLGVDPSSLARVAPALTEWLHKVFIVLGGFAFATGLLIAHLGSSVFRSRAEPPLLVITISGIASIGVMTAVNFALHSDYKWALVLVAALWTISVVLLAANSLPRKGRVTPERDVVTSSSIHDKPTGENT